MRIQSLRTLLLVSACLFGTKAIAESTNTFLASRTIVWTPGISSELQTNIYQAGSNSVAALVDFKSVLSPADHQLLQTSGVRLEEFLGQTAYIALVSSAGLMTNNSISSLVRAAEPLLAMDKLRVPTDTNQLSRLFFDPAANTLNLLVGFWRSLDSMTVTQQLGTIGLKGRRYGADNSWALTIQVDPAATFRQTLTNLCTLPGTKVVQQGPLPFLPLESHDRAAANTDAAQGFSVTPASTALMRPVPHYTGVTGEGIRIAICDDGIEQTHHDFWNINPITGSAWGSRVISPVSGGGQHGTLVASIAAGNGFHSSDEGYSDFEIRGHAPLALVADYGQFGADADLHSHALITESMRISNHSYVQSLTIYDLIASGLDELICGTGTDSNGNIIPARPSVWGAGNNGTSSPYYTDEEGYYSVETSAKNTVSVGSIDTATLRRSVFSSLGPTFDGRIKPDIVAPGNLTWENAGIDGLLGAYFFPQGYGSGSGTSIAAPVVSGIIALLMQQYAMSCPGCPELPPSMYKAILVQTATDLQKTGQEPEDVLSPNPDHVSVGQNLGTVYFAGPDFATGYGLVHAERARAKIADSSCRAQGSIIATGASHSWCIEVPVAAEELKVVLSWDDRPGCPLTAETAAKLVNDLDLTLTDPSGNVFRPWVLNSLPLTASAGSGAPDPIHLADVVPATHGTDHTNNVEMVTVPMPMSGTWTATITGFQIPFANGQSYSLVGSYPFVFCNTPPLARITTTLTANICDRFPMACQTQTRSVPKIDIVSGKIRVPTLIPIPWDQLCPYLSISARHCDEPSWRSSLRLNIRDLGAEAGLVVFNDSGAILQEVRGSDSNRLLSVPDHPPGTRLFFLAYEKIGTNLSIDLRLESAPVSSSVSEDPKPPLYEIQLPNRRFIPPPGIDPALRDMFKQTDHFPVHGVVQLFHSPSAQQRTNLVQKAIRLREFLGETAYFAEFSEPVRVETVTNLVRWMGVLKAEDKTDVQLWGGKADDSAQTGDGKVRVLVTFYRNIPPEQARQVLQKYGTNAEPYALAGSWSVSTSFPNIRALANESTVRWIRQRPPPGFIPL